jgi:succinyl-CoA synthetase alpha subunit
LILIFARRPGPKGIVIGDPMELEGKIIDYPCMIKAQAPIGGPGKSGQRVHGVPVFNTMREAAETVGANASIAFVPAKFTAESAYEAMGAGLPLVIVIAERVPVMDMMGVHHAARRKNCRVIGPNSCG